MLRLLLAAILSFMFNLGAENFPSVLNHPSLQEAVDANSGKMVYVPAGIHRIDKKLRLAERAAGLWGHGTIIQSNPDDIILEIEHAENVRIEGITFAREFTDDEMGANADGVFIYDSTRIDLTNIRVLNNRSQGAGIRVRDSSEVKINSCEIRDYKRIGVDDRTASPLYGYAFHCIDGSGIAVQGSRAVQLLANRVVEDRLLPTREIFGKYALGKLCEGKAPRKAGQLGESAVKEGYVNNWHQGSAIVITQAENTSHIRVHGNYISGAAQGVDIHADHVSVTDNIIDHAMMGIKATHGSRNLIISSNQLTHIDLWGILLNPGSASHVATPKTGDQEARPANVDGGTIISNNIISDFGYGHEFWNWGAKNADHDGAYCITLRDGQLPENPPLRDVIITGNVVYNQHRDGVLTDDGSVEYPQPRYRYALHIASWHGNAENSPNMPKGILIHNNIFHPGTGGISNVDIDSGLFSGNVSSD